MEPLQFPQLNCRFNAYFMVETILKTINKCAESSSFDAPVHFGLDVFTNFMAIYSDIFLG